MSEIKNSIFDKAIVNENSITELLRNFLRFQGFRDAFINLIELNIDTNNIDENSFSSQYSLNKYGRPDLALKAENIEILFEIKVSNDRGLTDNQPRGYFEYLDNISAVENKGLVLLVPNEYNIQKYEEILNLLKEKNSEIYTLVITWKHILKIITDNGLDEISLLFKEYSIFITNYFQLQSIYYDNLNTRVMFDTNTPKSLIKTMDIIESQFKEFQKYDSEVKMTKNYSIEYGFYFKHLEDGNALFFGIWFEYWGISGNPICIALSTESDRTVESFDKALEKEGLNISTKFEGYHVSFIQREILEREICCQEISQKLKNIIREL